MSSVVPGFEYDIFISYRQKDNLPSPGQQSNDGWVTEFVANLRKELEATFKDTISIYFDQNAHDGLLETHDVDHSLQNKLKCVVFIPVISQTYCDPTSFAWSNEFLAFRKSAEVDSLGLKLRLESGNVASRILPLRIHELDAADTALLQKEVGPIRSVDFIYKSAGVNRPLKAREDHPQDNVNRTFYNDQINKVANAIKEIIYSAKSGPVRTDSVLGQASRSEGPRSSPVSRTTAKKISLVGSGIMTILAAAYLVFYFFFQDKLGDRMQQSIAVMPFVNMSNDANQEYFSDGMTDEVLNRLYKIGNLKVISRTSSMKFKGAKLTAKEIAQELGVTNILEGSIQSSGNRIKVTVQLIDALADNHLWSETYEREFIDIFSIQADIATTVARELRIKLSPGSRSELAAMPTQSKLAYEFYLKGGDYRSKYDMDQAILMYSRAIQEDSLFALAYARRAHAHLFRYWLRNPGWEEHKELGHLDVEILKKIDPDLPELKVALAYWHYYGFREYDKALVFLKELQLKTPNSSDLHEILFAIYRGQGKWNESLLESEKALSLDPLNASNIHELCLAYGTLHRYKDLLNVAKRGLSLIPEFTGFRWQILTAEVNLHYDIKAAIQASGLSKEEVAGFEDYYNKNYSSSLISLRKQGVVMSNQNAYEPIWLNYARAYFLEGTRSLAKAYADSSLVFLKKKLPDMVNDERIYSSLGISYAISGQKKWPLNMVKRRWNSCRSA